MDIACNGSALADIEPAKNIATKRAEANFITGFSHKTVDSRVAQACTE
jgi:hypothetical protein